MFIILSHVRIGQTILAVLMIHLKSSSTSLHTSLGVHKVVFCDVLQCISLISTTSGAVANRFSVLLSLCCRLGWCVIGRSARQQQ